MGEKKTIWEALRRQRQADLCEFKASPVYKGSYQIARDAKRENNKANKQTNKQAKISKHKGLSCIRKGGQPCLLKE